MHSKYPHLIYLYFLSPPLCTLQAQDRTLSTYKEFWMRLRLSMNCTEDNHKPKEEKGTLSKSLLYRIYKHVFESFINHAKVSSELCLQVTLFCDPQPVISAIREQHDSRCVFKVISNMAVFFFQKEVLMSEIRE